MKVDRVFLAEWLGDYTDGYNDIPWPMIHDSAGHDVIRWLNRQDPSRCQMILEKNVDDQTGMQRLYAEFYDSRLRTEFALVHAK